MELGALYQDVMNKHDSASAEKISKAKGAIVKQQKEKRLELGKAEVEYRIDLSAKMLAKELDKITENEHLFNLYMQVRHRSIELVNISSAAANLAGKCGVEATAANNICWSFNKQILYNMEHDFKYQIHKPDKAALLDRLETRLQELKVESDKKADLENMIKGIEGE